MMKQIEATRYRNAERFSLIVSSWVSPWRPLPFALEHLQHALRDDKSAENIDRRQCHGDESHKFGEAEHGRSGLDHRTDDDHARYRVGNAHQRRMKRRGDAPDHVVTDKDGEHEHGQLEDERRAAVY